jgi:hypothetical protein
VTTIEVRIAGMTMAVVDPDTPACIAVIVAFPTTVPVISPWLPAALLTTAIAGADEVQVTEVVKFAALPSEKFPIAVSCKLVPLAKEKLGGVMSIEVRIGGVVVTPVDPETPPRVAVMVAFPTPVPVTSPRLPTALLTAASDGSEEVQVTRAVRFWVVPSEKSPVAISCLLVPLAIAELGGVMVIPVRVADVTTIKVDPDTPP